MNEFTKTIVEWYEENKRELPWRESADPYLIWISEIILLTDAGGAGVMIIFFALSSVFPMYRLWLLRMRTR